MRANRLAFNLIRTLVTLTLALSSTASVLASGPRWVSGPPFFAPTGFNITWYTTSPRYFTDPGDLSPFVSHAQADALVAQAAAVWNIPTASLVLTQGGSLNEHVSAANIAVAPTGLTFPSDVQAANFQNIPIAVLYDSDGSVTDLLLGAGASDPSGCRQAGVTESVDSISPGSQILHALLILNGRCTGPDPRQQLQLQYQLERAFGRVLGLAWSQTNDNVFTGTPTPTTEQQLNWPVMHPIDIICGLYTYQCMLQPFTLRPDDIASLALLYPIAQGQAPAGKQDSLANASTLDGYVQFPNGQGMEGVNVTVRRHKMFTDYIEPWQAVSAVSGFSFRRQAGTAITPQDGSEASSIGTYEDFREGYFKMGPIEIPTSDVWETLIITTEPINPLYTGPYALGAIAGNTMAPSGQTVTMESDIAARGYYNRYTLTPAAAAGQCNTGADGSLNAPASAAPLGWSNGTLCGYAHSAWTSLPIRAARTLTVEVTALDEQGNMTMTKGMPQIGAWRSTDNLGGAPTMGSAPAAFNSLVAGMTTLPIQTTTPVSLAIAVTDQRGAGRPDFNDQTRILYADSIAPANVPITGGVVTITGMGFRTGMSVLVRGVPATIQSISANTIVATVPSVRALGRTGSLIADVTVLDPATGGSSVMTAALGYASSSERLQVVSVPTGNTPVGSPALAPFTAQVLASDGVTPVAGEAVTFSVTGGSATLVACGAPTCTLQTNAHGLASTTITPTATGTISLTVATPSVSLSPFRFTAVAAPATLTLLSAPTRTLTTGSPAPISFSVRLAAAGTPQPGQSVTFSASGAAVSFGACGSAQCTVTTDASGLASTTVTLNAPGAAVLTATAGASSVSATVTAANAAMHLISAPTGFAGLGTPTPVSFSVSLIAGDGITPLPGQAIVFMANGGGVHFAPCGAAPCTVLSDAYGTATVTVTPTLAGAITLSAAANAGAVSSTFVAGPKTLHTLTAPSATVNIGTQAPTPFTVQLLQPDGSTPVAGAPVTFSITSGAAQLAACRSLPCTLTTDAQGRAAILLTPTAAGTVTVVATAAGSTQSITLTAIALPNILEQVSAPVASIYAGDTAATAFAVRILTGDRSQGVAGVPVTFSAAGAGALWTACGTATCVVLTDSTGLASTTIIGGSAGTVQLHATAAAGTVSASLAVLPRTRSITPSQPALLVAEGTPFSWTTQVALADSAATTNGVSVTWTGSPALHFAGTRSAATGSTAANTATISALGAGVTASGTACAWTGVCAGIAATGVSAADFQVAITEGATQTIGLTGTFAPVRLQVRNRAGLPVAGATVFLKQTVTSWQAPCAVHGRCGASAVLATSAATMSSDVNGYVLIQPETQPGVASVTTIGVSTGTQGFATVSLERHP